MKTPKIDVARLKSGLATTLVLCPGCQFEHIKKMLIADPKKRSLS